MRKWRENEDQIGRRLFQLLVIPCRRTVLFTPQLFQARNRLPIPRFIHAYFAFVHFLWRFDTYRSDSVPARLRSAFIGIGDSIVSKQHCLFIMHVARYMWLVSSRRVVKQMVSKKNTIIAELADRQILKTPSVTSGETRGCFTVKTVALRCMI